eukprot:372375-Pelagomonas_calceolata.AAC.2
MLDSQNLDWRGKLTNHICCGLVFDGTARGFILNMPMHCCSKLRVSKERKGKYPCSLGYYGREGYIAVPACGRWFMQGEGFMDE